LAKRIKRRKKKAPKKKKASHTLILTVL
jgi:hypothetical protein